MKNNPKIYKLPVGQPGTLNISIFQQNDPAQYFAQFTQRFMQCPQIEFKLLWKGTSTENRVASLLGSFVSIQQVPEILQNLKGTQFRLRCESPPSSIPTEIYFNLYDCNIEFSCPDFLEEQVMSFFSAESCDGWRK